MKIFLFDTETTGLSTKAEIWQLAGIILEDDKVIDLINVTFKPTDINNIDPEVFEKCHKTREDFESMSDRDESFNKLITFLNKNTSRKDRLICCGYNVNFDIQFLQKMFYIQKNQDYNKYFDFYSFDILSLVKVLILTGQISPLSAKLSDVCNEFKIKYDINKTHDALYDIKITKKLYDSITSRISFEPIV